MDSRLRQIRIIDGVTHCQCTRCRQWLGVHRFHALPALHPSACKLRPECKSCGLLLVRDAKRRRAASRRAAAADPATPMAQIARQRERKLAELIEREEANAR
jgi:hypothetical protein